MMKESSCCAVARKLGGYRCPICRKPIRLAKVLRLLRADARSWWYWAQLRKQGQIQKAIELERASIRENVRFIRENVGRPMKTYRTSVIEFTDTFHRKPFDLKPIGSGEGRTVSVSGCHPGFFAAWVYCYANRIGLKFTAKQHDMI